MEARSLALIGSGYWGKNLARNFDALGALGAICDKNEALLADFARLYPKAKGVLALSDVLGDPSITSVAIATPAETHFSIAREALLADKHVYVEKPLALEVPEAEELARLADQRGLRLMVGHLLQYHPVFERLLALVRSGELGRIDYVQSNRLNLGKIRREENILWSFAPHDVSMILSLAGEEPESVLAVGGNYLHEKIADVTTTHLKFPSGMRAHIYVSWLHPFKEQKLVVVGEKKMAVFDDTQGWDRKLLVYPHVIEWRDGAPVPVKAEPETPAVDQDEPLKCECRHFLECCASGTKPRTDGWEGVRVLRVLKAAQHSMDNSACAVAPATMDRAPKSGDPEIHETAVVDPGARIGAGTRIWHFAHVCGQAVIGRDCNLGQNVFVDNGAVIGDRCKVQNNVSVYKHVTLEDEVFCGPSMVFTNVYNPRAHIRKMDEARPTLVKRRATLGANCTIVCGNTVGRYAFVGAGAVVTRSVPDHALVAGSPARRIGWVCACGERLGDDHVCPACAAAYAENGEEGLMPRS